MPSESLSLSPRLEGKEFFGQQFERILREKAHLYDKEEVKKVLQNMAGDEFTEANRNIAILKSALRVFIKLPNFPQKERTEIARNLEELEKADPLSDRMNYYGTEEVDKKNIYAMNHNKNFGQYKSSIINLLKSLQNVLPTKMYENLISKDNMLAGLLRWVNQV
jgi:hypothetical protein